MLAEGHTKPIRSATCIAVTDVYLLSLHKSDFIGVLQQFRTHFNLKKDILLTTIPNLSQIVSQNAIENLVYTFKDEVFIKDHTITQEGESNDFVYIIKHGEVALLKNDLFLSLVDDSHNGLFGEDCLFEDFHEYTTVAISQNVKVFKIAQQSLRMRLPNFCLDALRLHYYKKKRYR